MKYLELKNISKSYEGRSVLRNFNLSITKGEFLVLLGPSGCGKSTILNIIAGLLPFENGRIIKNDVEITNLEPKDRNIGMVFQDHSLYPHMKVKANLLFPLKIRKLSKTEIDKRFREILKTYNLEEHLDKYPSQFL